MAGRREHPVLWGLVALVAVAMFLGLILGIGALAVSRKAGLGGADGGSTGNAGDSLYLPSPSETASSTSAEESDTKQPKPRRSAEAAEPAITLTAGQTAVSPMQEIDLTGTYPGGDGAILQVQRFEGGRWVTFPVTMSVGGEAFSTYVQTGQTGANKFRVADTGAGTFSNPVTVTVG